MIRSHPTTMELVIDALERARFHVQDEESLQFGVASALRSIDLLVEREVRLSSRDRIDFLVGDIGVELKVKGSRGRVLSQLQRYASHERVQALLLVTTKCALAFEPYYIGAKPVRSFVIFRGLA